MKILLDTSFLLSSIKYRIDIFEGLRFHKLVVLDGVKKELENLIKEKKAGRKEAKIALELIKKKKIKIIKAKKASVDDALVAEKNYIIATQDKELKKRLKPHNIITIRQKKYLKNVL